MKMWTHIIFLCWWERILKTHLVMTLSLFFLPKIVIFAQADKYSNLTTHKFSKCWNVFPNNLWNIFQRVSDAIYYSIILLIYYPTPHVDAYWEQYAMKVVRFTYKIFKFAEYTYLDIRLRKIRQLLKQIYSCDRNNPCKILGSNSPKIHSL